MVRIAPRTWGLVIWSMSMASTTSRTPRARMVSPQALDGVDAAGADEQGVVCQETGHIAFRAPR